MADKFNKTEYMNEYNKTPKSKQSKKDYLNSDKGKKVHKLNQQKYYSKYKGIYAIFDTDTLECLYIGASVRVTHRISIHKYAMNNLESAKKHRPTQFKLYELLSTHKSVTFELIDECNKNIINELEQFYINIYQPIYNIYKHK